MLPQVFRCTGAVRHIAMARHRAPITHSSLSSPLLILPHELLSRRTDIRGTISLARELVWPSPPSSSTTSCAVSPTAAALLCTCRHVVTSTPQNTSPAPPTRSSPTGCGAMPNPPLASRPIARLRRPSRLFTAMPVTVINGARTILPVTLHAPKSPPDHRGVRQASVLL